MVVHAEGLNLTNKRFCATNLEKDRGFAVNRDFFLTDENKGGRGNSVVKYLMTIIKH